jgi:hypothetical protein
MRECALRHKSDVFSNRRFDDQNKITVFRGADLEVVVLGWHYWRGQEAQVQPLGLNLTKK